MLWLKVKIICLGLRTDVRGAEPEGFATWEGASPPHSDKSPLFGRVNEWARVYGSQYQFGQVILLV